jgi:hypothetical protein
MKRIIKMSVYHILLPQRILIGNIKIIVKYSIFIEFLYCQSRFGSVSCESAFYGYLFFRLHCESYVSF